MPRFRLVVFSLAILSTLILTNSAFAAAPDRIAAPLSAGQTVRLAAGVPMQARAEFDRGAIDPSFKMSYMTLLTVPTAAQQRSLTKLLADQQNPRSASYHKWLTPEQYADRFGLSPNDIKKLSTWLQSQGFTVVTVARKRNWIAFSGTAAQVQSSFQTKIHAFDINGEKHFANVTPIAIPAALSGVVTGVRGLSDFRPKAHARQAKPDYTITVSGSNFAYLAPGDISTIYNTKPLYAGGFTGAGEGLAVMGQTDVYLADLNDFRNGFGLTQISGCTTNSTNVITDCSASNNFQYVVVPGNVDPGVPSSGDLGEADIDLEWSHASAPGAQIIYVNSPQSAGGVWDSWYYTVDQNLAPVITLSYGLCELFEAENGAVASDEAELQAANAEGITFLNSSGDSGAAECDFQTNNAVGGYAVSYPASSPSVTGVGGTLIPYNEYNSTYWNTTNAADGGSAKSYIPETAWNDAQEWSINCTANPSDGTCQNNPGLNDWFTAQENYVGLAAGGGGLSNCVNETGGVCAAPPNGGFARPSYQSSLAVPGQSSNVRFSPDVSLLASIYWPGFIVCTANSEVGGTGSASTCANGITSMLNQCFVKGGACSVFGGTSVSSPIFAGIVTVWNQYLEGPNARGLGNINATLYALAATPSNGAFHQLTTGSNGAFCTPGTPSTQPLALQCPNPAGFLGFDASNFDPNTGYNLVNGLGSVDANALALAWDAGRTATSITVDASPTAVIVGTPVTLHADLAPSSGTGNVTFTTDNPSTTTLGTAPLLSGRATLTWTPTVSQVGTNNINVSYAGDVQNMPSTSTVAAVVNVTAPTFTVSTPTTPTAVLSGLETTSTFTVTATGTGVTTFAGNVTFSCGGLPDATVTCSAPTILANTPSPVVETLTITTTGPNVGAIPQKRRADNRSPWLPLTLPLAGVVMLGVAGRKLSRYSMVASMLVALALVGFLIACGSSSHPIAVSAVTGAKSSLFANYATDGWPSQTTTFTASVTNDGANKGVTWSASAGTIDSSGNYTAPTIAVGLPSSVTITATSVADPSKSGTGKLTLTPATVPTAVVGAPYSITVSATEAGNTTPVTAPVSLTVN
jgi:hypothetical protein